MWTECWLLTHHSDGVELIYAPNGRNCFLLYFAEFKNEKKKTDFNRSKYTSFERWNIEWMAYKWHIQIVTLANVCYDAVRQRGRKIFNENLKLLNCIFALTVGISYTDFVFAASSEENGRAHLQEQLLWLVVCFFIPFCWNIFMVRLRQVTSYHNWNARNLS